MLARSLTPPRMGTPTRYWNLMLYCGCESFWTQGAELLRNQAPAGPLSEPEGDSGDGPSSRTAPASGVSAPASPAPNVPKNRRRELIGLPSFPRLSPEATPT